MKQILTKYILLFLWTLLAVIQQLNAKEKETAITYCLQENIPYAIDNSDIYARERCTLDIYYPQNVQDFATVIWFHGGGLTEGEKYIPQELKNKEIAVVAVNYRLSPNVKCPVYIQDAAAAVAWTFGHIDQFGGNTRKIYVSGHSAGGYLALMLALDKSYLAAHSIVPDSVAAWFPVSGQTMTHYTIRQERRQDSSIPVIDQYAPCAHLVSRTSPIVLLTGDRKMELAARYEENAYLKALLESVGNSFISLYEIHGFDHSDVYQPACLFLAEYIRKQENQK